MLIGSPKSNKRILKTISFRADKEIVNEFKIMCKKHNVKQITVIENAMIKAIEEMREMEKKENDRQSI